MTAEKKYLVCQKEAFDHCGSIVEIENKVWDLELILYSFEQFEKEFPLTPVHEAHLDELAKLVHERIDRYKTTMVSMWKVQEELNEKETRAKAEYAAEYNVEYEATFK